MAPNQFPVTKAYSPTSLGEALQIVAELAEPPVFVAGCTDLMVVDHAEHRRHGAVLDVTRLPELQGIAASGDAIEIGAACSFYQIRHDPLVREQLPILAEVASTVGAWQIQNRATLGGNIANASPAGDSLPVLLALEAEVIVRGPGGARVVPYPAMHVGYRRTALAPGELIVRVRVPRPPANGVQQFKKVGTREAQAISKVVVAMTARRAAGRLERVRFAAGSVAATPVRLLGAEQACEGRAPDEATAARAGEWAAAEVQPIDDVRSNRDYRRFALQRVVRRMVQRAGH